ncbi:MAG TPA: DUF86 domain-containing protein [Desulfuromonadales bacterium]|nr:DUF86 domain-containing protein [Desulfuromonadales bacterium]
MTAKQRELRLSDFLEHVIEASALACSYIEGMDIEAFRADKKTQQAVILNLMVIGEAATQIINEYPEFVAEHPEVPWRQIRGMRNRMAHGYFEINLDIVWDTVQVSIPSMRENVQKLLTK